MQTIFPPPFSKVALIVKLLPRDLNSFHRLNNFLRPWLCPGGGGVSQSDPETGHDSVSLETHFDLCWTAANCRRPGPCTQRVTVKMTATGIFKGVLGLYRSHEEPRALRSFNVVSCTNHPPPPKATGHEGPRAPDSARPVWTGRQDGGRRWGEGWGHRGGSRPCSPTGRLRVGGVVILHVHLALVRCKQAQDRGR